MSKINGRTFMAIIADQKHLSDSLASDYEKEWTKGETSAKGRYQHNATLAAICGYLLNEAKRKRLDNLEFEHHLETTFTVKVASKEAARECIQDALEFVALTIADDPTIQIEKMTSGTIKYLLLRANESHSHVMQEFASARSPEKEQSSNFLERRSSESQKLLRAFINECLK